MVSWNDKCSFILSSTHKALFSGLRDFLGYYKEVVCVWVSLPDIGTSSLEHSAVFLPLIAAINSTHAHHTAFSNLPSWLLLGVTFSDLSMHVERQAHVLSFVGANPLDKVIS